jgi:acyl-CoA synthetase (AMP-forming)/AMP-acid ligase II
LIPPPDPTAGLLETLAARARTNPSAIAVHFEGRDLTIGRLWREINGVAEALEGRGFSSGDRVVLIHPNSPEFLAAFFGVQLAGGVAVPVFPDSGSKRVADIARSCGAAAILVSSRLSETRLEEILEVGNTAGLTVLSPHDCAEPAAATDRPFPRHDQLAYLQYTSGSTGNPKGVKLTHGNLVTNIHQMIEGFEITADDVFVSWLPVSHDMGLILMTMTPLLLSARLILMPTSVGSIRRWMATIAEYRGTFTAAPDFAYRIAVRAASPRRSLDLSCLRVALNAAEPVRAKTIVDFESTFKTGHRVVPAYGLAEATVGVAGRPPGSEVKVDDRGLVSAGTPFPGIEIEIHGESGTVETAEVGEIVVRSPAATSGYYLNPTATATLLTTDGAIRTGDMGYLDSDGELFIAGRKKSIIIQAGRNIAPQEIEETVDELDFVRRSAAIGVDRGGPEGEQAWVVVEIRASERAGKERHPEMVIEIVQAIRNRLGRRPGRVLLVHARTIPLTHNGKVRHLNLRKQLLDGSIHDQGRIIYPVH